MALNKGDIYSLSRVFSVEDVLAFADFTGDKGRHHVELDAQGRLVVHALLVLSIVTKIGGENHFLLRDMSCSFVRPTFTGEQISCELVITDAENLGARTSVKIAFTCRSELGKEVLTGTGQGVILH